MRAHTIELFHAPVVGASDSAGEECLLRVEDVLELVHWFLQNRSQGACLMALIAVFVPITIQGARFFPSSVVADDVSVGDTSNLSFLYEACDIRRHRPTEQCLHDDSVLFTWDHLDYFDPKITVGLRKPRPDFFKTAGPA